MADSKDGGEGVLAAAAAAAAAVEGDADGLDTDSKGSDPNEEGGGEAGGGGEEGVKEGAATVATVATVGLLAAIRGGDLMAVYHCIVCKTSLAPSRSDSGGGDVSEGSEGSEGSDGGDSGGDDGGDRGDGTDGGDGGMVGEWLINDVVVPDTGETALHVAAAIGDSAICEVTFP